MASTRYLPLGAALLAAASTVNGQSTDNSGPKQLPAVTVSGRAPDPSGSPSGATEFDDVPLSKTPAAVDVVTTRDLREDGVRSLSGMARSLSSVSDSYNTVGYIESLQIRGFQLDSSTPLNFRRNGLPVSNYMPVALENKESVEIEKGLNGAVAGSSSPGGMINYVTKRPTESLREINTEVSERGTWIASADLSDRAGPFGYRLNVAAEDRRPIAQDAPGDRRFAAGAFDLKLPHDGIFEFEVEWQRYRQISVPGFGLLAQGNDTVGTVLPAPIDPSINLNNQPWSLPFESRSVVGTVRYEQPISSNFSVGLRALDQRIRTNDRIAFPDGCSSGPVYVYPGLCANYDVDVYDYRSNDELRTTHSSEAYAIARFATAGVEHRLQFGVRATRYEERLPPLQAYNFVGTTNVFAPVVLQPDPTLSVVNAERDLALDEAYAYDALKFGPRWSLWIGARYARVQDRSELSDGSEGVVYNRDLVTPWAALGWQAWESGFFYVSAGSGIEEEVVPNRPPDFANPGQVLPIGRSRQVEGGYKQGFGDSGNLTVAIFQIRKPYSVDIAQAAGPPLRVANGRIAQHRGIELGLNGTPTPILALDLQATYLDARNTDATSPSVDIGGLPVDLNGKRVTNVPNLAASLGANVRPSQAIDLQWRNKLSYWGTKEVTASNSVALPASWQWDTIVLWSPPGVHPHLQLRVGIDNVTNRHYWREAPTQSWGAIYLFPAQPRTYRAGMTLQF